MIARPGGEQVAQYFQKVQHLAGGNQCDQICGKYLTQYFFKVFVNFLWLIWPIFCTCFCKLFCYWVNFQCCKWPNISHELALRPHCLQHNFPPYLGWIRQLLQSKQKQAIRFVSTTICRSLNMVPR